ncbi:MAG: sigma 54-interacting transcriptional regulator [Desulfobacterales bacterium]|nr:sigma 54-interacting transcriptional regulator [Desulfobacterales bacterium]
MEKLKLVVIAVQAGYLKKLTGQLRAMFGDRIGIRAFQLGMFDKEEIHPDEVVFSAIPNLDKLVTASFPGIKGFIRARRAVNLVNTGEIMALEENRRILVVGDHEDVTRKVIRELAESGFVHQYLPFHPGMDPADPVDCAVTTGEVELVPENIEHVINIGLRVISLETMRELNGTYKIGLDEAQINRQYILSLVHVSANWPVSRKNKYISDWIGTRQDDHPEQRFSDFIAESPAMKLFVRQAASLCPGDHPIHIDGEIGVGKRRVAIAIHNESRGGRGEFYWINCTGDGQNLEKNLFGWEDAGGIFPGLLESAGQGTVCIEEIENMPLDLQERLAGVLTDHTLVRSGGHQPVPSSARVVTTGSQALTLSFKEKKIRQALYHHLSLHICTMPSLARRREDFSLLIKKFLEQDLNRPGLVIEPRALAVLKAYSWEGNVQEFYNVIFHLACLGEKKITANMLPFYIYNSPGPATDPEDAQDATAIIREIEKTGFLDEYLRILEVYSRGKKENQSFGRAVVIQRLSEKGLVLTKQKLRRKQEHLNELGLLRVMKGRAGTTISRAGEEFLIQAKQGK